MSFEPPCLRPCPPALDTERNAGNDETGTERAEDESSEGDAVEIPDDESHGSRRSVLKRKDSEGSSEQRDHEIAERHEAF